MRWTYWWRTKKDVKIVISNYKACVEFFFLLTSKRAVWYILQPARQIHVLYCELYITSLILWTLYSDQLRLHWRPQPELANFYKAGRLANVYKVGRLVNFYKVGRLTLGNKQYWMNQSIQCASEIKHLLYKKERGLWSRWSVEANSNSIFINKSIGYYFKHQCFCTSLSSTSNALDNCNCFTDKSIHTYVLK